jgi:hypothetical protein
MNQTPIESPNDRPHDRRSNHHHWPAIACVLLTGFASSACFIGEDDRPRRRTVVYEPTYPPVTPGKLTVRWTIDGKTDPNECVKAVATDFELSVTDSSGREIGAWRQPCRYFSLTVTLNPGTNAGSAILLDGAAHPRTTRVAIDAFVIRGNDTLDVPVDFPANSFL